MTHHVNNTIMKIDYERVIQQKEIMADFSKNTSPSYVDYFNFFLFPKFVVWQTFNK